LLISGADAFSFVKGCVVSELPLSLANAGALSETKHKRQGTADRKRL
jgi:hypothetical protein